MDSKDVYDRIFKKFLDTLTNSHIQQHEGDEIDGANIGARDDQQQHDGRGIAKDEASRGDH